MSVLAQVVRTEGLPISLYTDRAGWAFFTPSATGPVDKTRLTQVGGALHQLGIEHIPAYSPQAVSGGIGRRKTTAGECLRVAGIRTVDAANRYLRDVYVPQHNATFRCP